MSLFTGFSMTWSGFYTGNPYNEGYFSPDDDCMRCCRSLIYSCTAFVVHIKKMNPTACGEFRTTDFRSFNCSSVKFLGLFVIFCYICYISCGYLLYACVAANLPVLLEHISTSNLFSQGLCPFFCKLLLIILFLLYESFSLRYNSFRSSRVYAGRNASPFGTSIILYPKDL